MLPPSAAATPSVPAGGAHRVGNVDLRPDEVQVLVDGRRAGLTVREYELFAVLVARHDRVVPRPRIYEEVWGGTMPRRDRLVDVFVRKVRIKLAIVAPEWEYIHTHFGIGYRFAPVRVHSAGSSAPKSP